MDEDKKLTEDEIWTKRYVLITKNIPIFFNRNFAQKIFEIGKCINFIRKFCDESTYSLLKIKVKLRDECEKIQLEEKNKMQIDNEGLFQNFEKLASLKNSLNLISNLEDDSKLNLNLLPHLFTEIDLIYNEVNKELISIIFDKFKFMENLKSINRYLLLGQGDMMQYLMDLLFNELKKPAIQIYKHNLLNILETAIRASNAQYHDSECLKRLNIRLLDSSAGDLGWDIFVLEYNVDIPLNVIFSKTLLKDYQKLFFFFWKLKRLEFSQDHQIWRNFMTYSHSLRNRFEHLRPYIQKSMLFNRQIIHFVTNLHNYIALEVLETEYKKIIEKIPQITKLDSLIELHKKFVESVIEQSLLNFESNFLYKKILQIFDLIFRFKTAQDVLITTLFEEYYRNMDSFNYSGREYDGYDQSEIKFSKEAYNQISILFEDFKNEITELINHLDLVGKGNLKYLAMRLDYNYYYSERELENIHKKQRQHFDNYDDCGEDQEENFNDEDEPEPQKSLKIQNESRNNLYIENKYEKYINFQQSQVDQSGDEEEVKTTIKRSGEKQFNMNDFIYQAEQQEDEVGDKSQNMHKMSFQNNNSQEDS